MEGDGSLYPPCCRVQNNGPGLVQIFRDQDLAHGPVEPRHLYAVRARVGPVQVAGDPVHGDAVRVVDLGGDHELGLAAVQVGAPDGVHVVVRPVHVAVHRVVVDGDGVADVVRLQDDVGEVRRVQGDSAKVCATGQEKDLGRTWREGWG